MKKLKLSSKSNMILKGLYKGCIHKRLIQGKRAQSINKTYIAERKEYYNVVWADAFTLILRIIPVSLNIKALLIVLQKAKPHERVFHQSF